MSAVDWLKPVELVEKIGNGFFKLNDRQTRFSMDNGAFWNDVEFPKVSKDVYSDKYRIQKFSCLFDTHLNDLEPILLHHPLLAIQLTFESVEKPEEVVVAPVNGVKARNTPWTYELELEPGETLIGMRHYAESGSLYVKTSHGKVINMFNGEEGINVEVWTLPPGFRIYGFHGAFCGSIIFFGPIFKAMELRQWDQSLYKELPRRFKRSFQMMVLMKNRHRREGPETGVDFWSMPESVWDQVAHTLLYETYYDMDRGTFFKGIAKFFC